MHAIRESTDLIVELSTGGAVTDRLDDLVAVLDAAPDGVRSPAGP